jgi:endonuclease YncB( thermonuclease family)
MRWPLIALLLQLPTLACAVPSKHVLMGKVVKITDGDTVTILTRDRKEERIRLWGIDTPEQRGGQPFWRASRNQLASLVRTLGWFASDHIPVDCSVSLPA